MPVVPVLTSFGPLPLLSVVQRSIRGHLTRRWLRQTLFAIVCQRWFRLRLRHIESSGYARLIQRAWRLRRLRSLSAVCATIGRVVALVIQERLQGSESQRHTMSVSRTDSVAMVDRESPGARLFGDKQHDDFSPRHELHLQVVEEQHSAFVADAVEWIVSAVALQCVDPQGLPAVSPQYADVRSESDPFVNDAHGAVMPEANVDPASLGKAVGLAVGKAVCDSVNLAIADTSSGTSVSKHARHEASPRANLDALMSAPPLKVSAPLTLSLLPVPRHQPCTPP